MIYRIANEKDIPALAALRAAQLVDEGQTADRDIREQLEDFFQKKIAGGSLMQWIAEDGDVIAATGGVLFLDFPPTFSNPHGRRAYITNMYTLPAFRRQGLASELLRRLIRDAKATGISHIFLSASDMGKPVYEKYGFETADWYMVLDPEADW